MTCSGQTEWRHEKLLEHVPYMLVNHWNVGVNPSGIPTYIAETDETVFLHAWRGRTDLNRMYLPDPSAARAVSINSSGQVAYTALTLDSVHIMVDGHDYFADLL